MMLASYTNSICLESWGKSIYARIMIEIDTCNGFSDNLGMAIRNLKGPEYTKETIRVEYEWEPPRCSFIKVKRKKSSGHGGTNNFNSVSVKPKTQYSLRVNQTTEEVSLKTASSVGKKNVSTSGNSSKKTNMNNTMTSGNDIFSLSNSFEALNVDDQVTMEVESGNKASTSGVQEEENSSTSLVEKIHSEDEIDPSDNKMASFLASKLLRVGYGTNSLLEQ
ncbi:hypothetical protein Tco_1335402 [Tanacetum coccineum]